MAKHCITCGSTKNLKYVDWLNRRMRCRNCQEKPIRVVMPISNVSEAWLERERQTRERIIAKHG